MPRKSLRPQLNQIRAWVRQGRTDAWIAHQLEVTVQEIQQFKRQNELVGSEDVAAGAAAIDFSEEIDLRAEDDALIAAQLEAAAREAERERAERERAEADAAAKRAEAEATAEQAETEAERERAERETGEGEEDGPEEAAAPRRRSRRGGRGRRRAGGRTAPLEGTFDHGEEGYGLWLDPAVQDNPIYAEHWAGHRPVEVTIEEDQIVIRRVGED
jgi:hypothetical protein